jgi:hypothetical protein
MEYFVPYELAVKLEQKGFKQGYNIFGFRPIFPDETTIRFISDIGAYEKEYFGENISAPTISQVLDWLRDEKKIYVSVEVEREDWFEYKIVQTIKNTHGTGTRVYKNYSEAILAGIEYVIDNNLI